MCIIWVLTLRFLQGLINKKGMPAPGVQDLHTIRSNNIRMLVVKSSIKNRKRVYSAVDTTLAHLLLKCISFFVASYLDFRPESQNNGQCTLKSPGIRFI